MTRLQMILSPAKTMNFAPSAVERARAVVESDATSASRRASVGPSAREGAREVD